MTCIKCSNKFSVGIVCHCGFTECIQCFRRDLTVRGPHTCDRCGLSRMDLMTLAKCSINVDAFISSTPSYVANCKKKIRQRIIEQNAETFSEIDILDDFDEGIGRFEIEDQCRNCVALNADDDQPLGVLCEACYNWIFFQARLKIDRLLFTTEDRSMMTLAHYHYTNPDAKSKYNYIYLCLIWMDYFSGVVEHLRSHVMKGLVVAHARHDLFIEMDHLENVGFVIDMHDECVIHINRCIKRFVLAAMEYMPEFTERFDQSYPKMVDKIGRILSIYEGFVPSSVTDCMI